MSHLGPERDVVFAPVQPTGVKRLFEAMEAILAAAERDGLTEKSSRLRWKLTMRSVGDRSPPG